MKKKGKFSSTNKGSLRKAKVKRKTAALRTVPKEGAILKACCPRLCKLQKVTFSWADWIAPIQTQHKTQKMVPSPAPARCIEFSLPKLQQCGDSWLQGWAYDIDLPYRSWQLEFLICRWGEDPLVPVYLSPWIKRSASKEGGLEQTMPPGWQRSQLSQHL